MAVAAVATGVVGGIVVVVLTAVGVRFVTQLYFLKEIRRGRHHDLGRIFPRKTSFEKATAVVDDDGFAVVERGHGPSCQLFEYSAMDWYEMLMRQLVRQQTTRGINKCGAVNGGHLIKLELAR